MWREFILGREFMKSGFMVVGREILAFSAEIAYMIGEELLEGLAYLGKGSR